MAASTSEQASSLPESAFIYSKIPAPILRSGSRLSAHAAISTAAVPAKAVGPTGRELSAGIISAETVTAATSEELAAIEAAIQQLEMASAKEATAKKQQQAEPVSLRKRAATLADGVPPTHKPAPVPTPMRPSAASTESLKPASAGHANEQDPISPSTDVQDMVASLQATISALESTGADMTSPEVQAVLAEAGNMIADIEAAGNRPAAAPRAGRNTPGLQARHHAHAEARHHARAEDRLLSSHADSRDSVDGQRMQRMHAGMDVAGREGAGRSMQHMPARQHMAERQERPARHAAKPEVESDSAWVSMQAEPMQDFGSAHSMLGTARSSLNMPSEGKRPAAAAAAETPEGDAEVKKMIAELEAAVAAAEAAAGIGKQA